MDIQHNSLIIYFSFIFRGFGFITFKDSDSVTKVLNTHESEPITIEGKEVCIKKSNALVNKHMWLSGYRGQGTGVAKIWISIINSIGTTLK